MRMRVIEAQHLEPALACVANRVDVILRVDEKPGRPRGEVSRRGRFSHRRALAGQPSAALAGRLSPRMRDDRLDASRTETDFNLQTSDFRLQTSDFRLYRVSTAIAIPIPPPMHSDATPYRSFRARSA